MIFNLISKAKDLFYNNKKSGLSANNTQDAIDELSGEVDGKATKASVEALANTVNDKVTNSFTAERALIAGTNGKVGVSGTTSTELYMLHGVTDYIQPQLNAKLPKAGGELTGKLTTQQVQCSTNYAVGANKNSYNQAPFVANAPYINNNACRAGYGFHNAGSNGTFLYLDTDSKLKHINNGGVVRVLMDSSNFSYDASTGTLNITL